MIVRYKFALLLLWSIVSFTSAQMVNLRGRKFPFAEAEPVRIYLLNDNTESISLDDLPSPTLQPTVEPMVYTPSPTIEETHTPTESPFDSDGFGFRPSAVPTRQPTSRPSLAPSEIVKTAIPTLSPTAELTAAPTESPSLLITAHPTYSPTYSPTYDPTADPTLAPSVVITAAPTASPTFEPTVPPTLQPTQSPTPVGTLVPTFELTLAPTFAPTFAPTLEPTFAPTVVSSLHSTIQCRAINTTSRIVDDLNTSSMTIGLIDSNFNYSTSQLWSVRRNFTMALRNLNLNSYPTEISSYVSLASCLSPYSSHINHQFSSATCQDTQRVNFMWLSFLSNRPFSVMCGSTRWMAAVCSDSTYRSCTNCTTPCSGFPWPSLSRAGESAFRWASVVAFSLQPNRNLWPEWTQVSYPSGFGITIHVNLSFAGRIYCAAYPESRSINSPMTILLDPSSSMIEVRDDVAPAYSGELRITGLFPDTTYQVVCATMGLNQVVSTLPGRTPSLARIMQSAERIHTATASLPTVRVSFPDASVVENQVSNAIAVQLSLPFGRNLTLVPSVTFVSPQLCTGQSTNTSGAQFESLDVDIGLAPSQMYFGSFDTSTKYLYLLLPTVGCYELSFAYQFDDTSTVAAQVVNRAVFGNNNLKERMMPGSSYQLNCTETPVIPDVFPMSLVYESTGIDALLTLSSAVDVGSNPTYMINFPCERVARFNGSATASCRFSRPNLLRISIPTSMDGLEPGDVVELLGQVMKPVCPVKNTAFCGTIPYIPTRRIALSSSGIVPVVAALSASSLVTARGNLTLDASTSTGNGGRAWSYQWTVSFNGSTSNLVARRLQTAMNDHEQFRWFGCVPQSLTCGTLSGDLLAVPGDYIFSLRLANFLGYDDSVSVAVTVLPDYFVPSVRIIGGALQSQYVNTSVVLRVYIDSATFICPVPLEIDWLTYIDDQSTPVSLPRQYSDPRTLVYSAYTLEPNHLYRFQVNVFCESVFAYAYVERFMLPVDLTTTLVPALQQVISMQYAFTLNGSLEYPLSMYGHPPDVTFWWSCLQIAPLDTNGCTAFYAYANESSPVIAFDRPDLIFAPSTKYQVGVTIASASLGVSFTTYQTLTTLNDSYATVPLINVDVPELYSTGQFGYVINASVAGPTTFVATWEIVSMNQVLYSRVFFEGSAGQLFPAIISPSLLPNRYFYTFRLSAFVPTDTCWSLTCMDTSQVTRVTFTTNVNRPPTSGSLDVTPRQGNEDTVFSIFAHNWQDVDLPLNYEFHQSTDEGTTFHLIRQRMVLSFTQTKLYVFPTGAANVTVLISGHIYDYHSARTVVTSSVNYVFIETVGNASALVDTATETATEVKRQLAGEYILAVTAGVVDAIDKLRCYELADDEVAMSSVPQGTFEDCVALVTAGTLGLDGSASYYNRGIGLLIGLAKYLRFLASVEPQMVTPSILSSVLRLYDYINAAVAVVGVRDAEGGQLVDSMLTATDKLIAILQTYNASDPRNLDYMVPLSTAMTKLFARYFTDMPFGADEIVVSSTYLNATMHKNYFTFSDTFESWNSSAWTKAASVSVLTPVSVTTATTASASSTASTSGSTTSSTSATASSTSSSAASSSATSYTISESSSSLGNDDATSSVALSIKDIAFSRGVFPVNQTAAYELFTIDDYLPVSSYTVDLGETTTYQHIRGAKRIRFNVFASDANDDDEENTNSAAAFLTLFYDVGPGVIDTPVASNSSWWYDDTVSWNVTSLGNQNATNTSNHVILYRNCSQADAATRLLTNVTCSPSQTGGHAYTFPAFQCPSHQNASQVVAFECPKYDVSIGCFVNGERYANVSDMWYSLEGNVTAVSCTYTLSSSETSRRRRLIASSIADSFVNVQGYFAVGKVTATLSLGSARLLPSSGESSGTRDGVASTSTSSDEMSYIAVVAIAVVGILFAAFMYYKMKHFIANNPADPVHRTEAVVVTPVPMTTAEILPVQWEEGHLSGQEVTTSSTSSVVVSSNTSSASSDDGRLTVEERPISFLAGQMQQLQRRWSASLVAALPTRPSSTPSSGLSRDQLAASTAANGSHGEWTSQACNLSAMPRGQGSDSGSAPSTDVIQIHSEASSSSDVRSAGSHSSAAGSAGQLSAGGVDLSTVPFIETADVEMIHIDAIAFPYLPV